MNKIKLTVAALFVITLSLVYFSLGDKPETEFPLLSSTVDYADVKLRMEAMANQVKKVEHFDDLLKPLILKNYWDVPNYESMLNFYYIKNEKNQFECVATESQKRSPRRSPDARISFHENKTIASYEEFIKGHLLDISFHDTGKLKHILFHHPYGERKIKFNDQEQIISDDFIRYPNREIQERLEINEEIESEIRESIAAGYTDIQKQPPRMLQLKLPRKLKEGEVKDRLTKIGEYHQAVVDGKVDPLADHKPFTIYKIIHGGFTVYIFYSGKKVAFVGATASGEWGEFGYYMVFDEYARLTKYVEGQIYIDINMTGHEVAKRAKLMWNENSFYPAGRPSGIEITFHPTGYPSCYRTIVKHRLFGKQMEWDDKGNVISDIDQDIPIPWPEAVKVEPL